MELPCSSISTGVRPTIGQDVLPGDVARLLAAQESADGAELLGRAITAHRNLRLSLIHI